MFHQSPKWGQPDMVNQSISVRKISATRLSSKPVDNAMATAQQRTVHSAWYAVHSAQYITEDGDLPFLPMELWATMHISKWEEATMGIPVGKTDE
jgi:hypothetical protein